MYKKTDCSFFSVSVIRLLATAQGRKSRTAIPPEEQPRETRTTGEDLQPSIGTIGTH